LPEKRINGSKVQINKIHPISKEILNTYVSVNDVIKENKMSRQTLYKCIEHQLLKNGYYWKYAA
jgi:hypothetical protein